MIHATEKVNVMYKNNLALRFKYIQYGFGLFNLLHSSKRLHWLIRSRTTHLMDFEKSTADEKKKRIDQTLARKKITQPHIVQYFDWMSVYTSLPKPPNLIGYKKAKTPFKLNVFHTKTTNQFSHFSSATLDLHFSENLPNFLKENWSWKNGMFRTHCSSTVYWRNKRPMKCAQFTVYTHSLFSYYDAACWRLKYMRYVDEKEKFTKCTIIIFLRTRATSLVRWLVCLLYNWLRRTHIHSSVALLTYSQPKINIYVRVWPCWNFDCNEQIQNNESRVRQNERKKERKNNEQPSNVTLSLPTAPKLLLSPNDSAIYIGSHLCMINIIIIVITISSTRT